MHSFILHLLIKSQSKRTKKQFTYKKTFPSSTFGNSYFHPVFPLSAQVRFLSLFEPLHLSLFEPLLHPAPPVSAPPLPRHSNSLTLTSCSICLSNMHSRLACGGLWRGGDPLAFPPLRAIQGCFLSYSLSSHILSFSRRPYLLCSSSP